MNKPLIRSIGLLLVPCLIGNPVAASSFTKPSFSAYPTITASTLFDQQAIVARLRESFRRGGDRQAARQVLLHPLHIERDSWWGGAFLHYRRLAQGLPTFDPEDDQVFIYRGAMQDTFKLMQTIPWVSLPTPSFAALMIQPPSEIAEWLRNDVASFKESQRSMEDMEEEASTHWSDSLLDKEVRLHAVRDFIFKHHRRAIERHRGGVFLKKQIEPVELTGALEERMLDVRVHWAYGELIGYFESWLDASMEINNELGDASFRRMYLAHQHANASAHPEDPLHVEGGVTQDHPPIGRFRNAKFLSLVMWLLIWGFGSGFSRGPEPPEPLQHMSREALLKIGAVTPHFAWMYDPWILSGLAALTAAGAAAFGFWSWDRWTPRERVHRLGGAGIFLAVSGFLGTTLHAQEPLAFVILKGVFYAWISPYGLFIASLLGIALAHWMLDVLTPLRHAIYKKWPPSFLRATVYLETVQGGSVDKYAEERSRRIQRATRQRRHGPLINALYRMADLSGATRHRLVANFQSELAPSERQLVNDFFHVENLLSRYLQQPDDDGARFFLMGLLEDLAAMADVLPYQFKLGDLDPAVKKQLARKTKTDPSQVLWLLPYLERIFSDADRLLKTPRPPSPPRTPWQTLGRAGVMIKSVGVILAAHIRGMRTSHPGELLHAA